MKPRAMKRLRSVAMFLLYTVGNTMSAAFVHSNSNRPNFVERGSRQCSALHSTRGNASPKLPRLTPREQKQLLGQAVEARRIKEMETKLALESASLQLRRSEMGVALGYDKDELEDALYRGQLAREKLVTHNMGLVYYYANEILGKQRQKFQSLSREDLIQEGAIGLARAVDRWNPEIGGAFSTYAMYWIRAAMLRGIAQRDDIVRVPEHVSTAVRKVTRAARTLGLDVDGEDILSNLYSSSSSSANWKEAEAAKALAEEAGLTNKQVVEAMKVRRRRNSGIVSFESLVQQGRDFSPKSEEDEAAARASNVEKEHLKTTLSQYLRPREMEALSWRYGLNNEMSSSRKKVEGNLVANKPTREMPVRGKWGEAMSFVEVGKRMEVSAEYCRRLCKAGINKLQQAAEEGMLQPSLFSI